MTYKLQIYDDPGSGVIDKVEDLSEGYNFAN